jgi:hypothetical protein
MSHRNPHFLRGGRCLPVIPQLTIVTMLPLLVTVLLDTQHAIVYRVYLNIE